MYIQMLPSFNKFRGAIDRERNGSTGKEMARPGKQTPSEGTACPLCPPASYTTALELLLGFDWYSALSVIFGGYRRYTIIWYDWI